MLRFLRYTFEYIAAFVGFVILLALVVAWRLSTHPISSDFLTPYIEEGVESLVPHTDVHIKSTLITWNNIDHSVSLHAENLKIINADNTEIADIPSFDARISILGLLFGQFLPKYLAIDHPQIDIVRAKDGSFVFGGVTVGQGAAQPRSQPQPIKTVLHHISEKLSHAALMHMLSVTHAVIDVHDEVTQKDWTLNVPELSITRKLIGDAGHRLEYGALDGRMSVELTQQNTTAKLDVHYVYQPAKSIHDISVSFAGLNPASLAGDHPESLGIPVKVAAINLPFSGTIDTIFDKNLDIASTQAHIHSDAGQIIYPAFWDHPLTVKSADMTAAYDRALQKITVSDTHIDLDGPVLSLDVTTDTDAATPNKNLSNIDFTAVVQIDTMPMNSYDLLCPKPVLPDPRYWLVANLRDGMFTHAIATVKGAVDPAHPSSLSVTDVNGKLSAVGGKVTYLDGMPPATNVSAEASFDLKQMSVQIISGGIGAIRMQPFTLQITGLSDIDQAIDIPLQVSGPIPDIMRLLNNPPLGYAKKLGVAPDDIDGAVQGSVHFKFPLLKTIETKDLDIKVNATATGVASTKLVPGVAIDQGNLALTLDMNGFGLKGQANLDKIPFQVIFQQSFEAQPGKPMQQADLVGVIKEDQRPNLGIDIFTGTKGPINVTFQMLRTSKTKMQFNGALDMTAAAVNIDKLGWKKSAASPAFFKFSADAQDGQPVRVTSLNLRGDQVSATGTATMSSDLTQILGADIAPLVIGRTKANVHFNQSFGPGGMLQIDASGEALDISGFNHNAQPDKDAATPDTRPQHYKIRLDHLYTGASGEIQLAQGFATRDAQGWREINMHGVVGSEQKPLSIELTPQPDGHRTLAIAFEDFGAAMKGLGFTDTIEGGKLTVSGQSTVEAPGAIAATSTISAFTIRKLPALALLLNATSPFGFTGILTDSASFSRSEGAFIWDGDNLTLTKAHAAGSAIGINVDGKVDLGTGVADLQGTLVPFSVMNSVLNYIPVVGNIITGGKDQGVLAVTYKIKGPLSAPDISVNPVSLLTPGFLRNLFFRDDDINQPVNKDEK